LLVAGQYSPRLLAELRGLLRGRDMGEEMKGKERKGKLIFCD